MMTRRWVPISVVMKCLQCSRTTVYRYLEAGEIEGVQRVPNGRWLVDRESLEKKFSAILAVLGTENTRERLLVNQDGR